MIHDCILIANNIPFRWNEKFPINFLNLMRGFLIINDDEKDKYFDHVSMHIENNIDISKDENIKKILTDCEISYYSIMELKIKY